MFTDERLRQLLAAATELGEARRHDSDTSEEWDALERAIVAAEEAGDPTYTFAGEHFERHAIAADGCKRLDACDIDDVEFIAQTIEEDADPEGLGWFVVDDLVGTSGRTWMKCLIAVEFMKSAGLLRQRAIDGRITCGDDFSADAARDAYRQRIDRAAV